MASKALGARLEVCNAKSHWSGLCSESIDRGVRTGRHRIVFHHHGRVDNDYHNSLVDRDQHYRGIHDDIDHLARTSRMDSRVPRTESHARNGRTRRAWIGLLPWQR